MTSALSVPRARWNANVFPVVAPDSLNAASSTRMDVARAHSEDGSESESLSPLRNEPGNMDSPPARRAKLDHLLRHSVDAPVRVVRPPATDEEIATAEPVLSTLATESCMNASDPDAAASSSHTGQVQRRAFMYGECPKCGFALKPAVPMSGSHKGKFILRCNNFDRYEHGQRRCWFFKPYDGDESTLPKGIRDRRKRLLGDLTFHFR